MPVVLPELHFREGVSDLFLTPDNDGDFFQTFCWNDIPKHKCNKKCPYFIKKVTVYRRSSSTMLLCKRDPKRVEEIRARWRARHGVEHPTPNRDRVFSGEYEPQHHRHPQQQQAVVAH